MFKRGSDSLQEQLLGGTQGPSGSGDIELQREPRAIQLTKIKVKRKQDGKQNREEQRVESVLTGKQASTKAQVFNTQYKAPAGALCSLHIWEV